MCISKRNCLHTVRMSSLKFICTCRDLLHFGDSVVIAYIKKTNNKNNFHKTIFNQHNNSPLFSTKYRIWCFNKKQLFLSSFKFSGDAHITSIGVKHKNLSKIKLWRQRKTNEFDLLKDLNNWNEPDEWKGKLF